MSTSLIKWEIDNVIHLAAFNVPRGKDSTGVAFVYEDKATKKMTTQVVKGVMNPVTFFDSSNVKEICNERPAFAIVGHNRLATIGHINIHNAHPMTVEHLVGTHNGTVDAFKPYKHEEDKITDSRNLYKHLAQYGLQSVIQEAGAAGAMALVWVDKKDNTLNFYRNTHRPLYYMYTTIGSTMYWSSERGTLALLAERDKCGYRAPEPFLLNKHYSIKLDAAPVMTIKEVKEYEFKYKITSEDVKKHNKKKDKKKDKSATPFKEGLMTAEEWLRAHTTTGPTTSAAGAAPPKTPTTTSVPSVLYTKEILPGDWYAGYNNDYWTISKTVEKLLKSGCCFCKKKPAIFEPVFWISDSDYVCRDHLPDIKAMTDDVHEGKIKRGH